MLLVLVLPWTVWRDGPVRYVARAVNVAQTGPDEGDNRHPSGRDRSEEHGKSGTQGKAKSDPDGDSNASGGLSGEDKQGFDGGVDKGDQDNNNGCGNDDDFEDDNNGRCLGKAGLALGPTVTPAPTAVPTAMPTPTVTVVPTSTPAPTPTPTSAPAPTPTSTPATSGQVLSGSLPPTGKLSEGVAVVLQALGLGIIGVVLLLKAGGWRRRDVVVMAMAGVLWMTGVVAAEKISAQVVPYLQAERPVRVVGKTREPVEISVPAVGIKTGVGVGGRVENKWILANDLALYSRESEQLVVYAHNTPKLFGRLGSVKMGDRVVLTDGSGRKTYYRVYGKRLVSPGEIGSLGTGNGRTVVLVSCGGAWERQRWVVKAEREMV